MTGFSDWFRIGRPIARHWNGLLTLIWCNPLGPDLSLRRLVCIGTRLDKAAECLIPESEHLNGQNRIENTQLNGTAEADALP